MRLSRSALFITGALPKKTYPAAVQPLRRRAQRFGNHIDNAVRTSKATGLWVRTDLSATLFLSQPDEYDGGELVIEDTFGTQSVKLAAGDLVLYPASSVHRVEPVTRGSRAGAFFWIESMVRDDAQRAPAVRPRHGDPGLARNSDGARRRAGVKLTGCYHNLLRMWADT